MLFISLVAQWSQVVNDTILGYSVEHSKPSPATLVDAEHGVICRINKDFTERVRDIPSAIRFRYLL